MRKRAKEEKLEKKKKTDWVLQAQLISQLRRLFVKSPMFAATKRAATRDRVTYNKDGSVSGRHCVERQCAICGEWFKDEKIVVETEDKKGKKATKKYHSVAVDHTEPFVPVEGLPTRENGRPDWNVLIDRMFLNVVVWRKDSSYEEIKDKARILCWKCHDKVTQEQNAQRREIKKSKEPNKVSKKQRKV